MSRLKFSPHLLESLKKFSAAPVFVASAMMISPSTVVAAAHGEVSEMSFEELAELEVTSVSKRPEPVSSAPASIFVITATDIRRSGAHSLTEALRLAPNLHVAQDNSIPGMITARGLNGSLTSTANKLLVLIDGRSVYTPFFSGVFWDVQDVVLEDIERIEVISGPAGTLWGLNAVNGVINVITRSASQTQGTLVSVGGGNQGSSTSMRHGGKLGDDGSFRVYAKYFEREHTNKEDGTALSDAWRKSQIGFRADWKRPHDLLSVQGNAYKGSEGQPAPGTVSTRGSTSLLDTITYSGANLSARWTRFLEGGSNMTFQAYYDRTERTVPPTFAETLDIIDLEMQHTLPRQGEHTVTWGANYRYSRDRITNSRFVAFLPASANQTWASLFVQDEIDLRHDLQLTLGARAERNEYTGVEFLPSARLAWKMSPDQLLWGAVSRAARVPARFDQATYLPGRTFPEEFPFGLLGGPNVRSEIAQVFEVGYRTKPGSKSTFSATVFHAKYDHLRTQEASPDFTSAVWANGLEGAASGIELWGAYQATRSWRLTAGYTALRERLWSKPGSVDTASPSYSGNDPAHTWQLRSRFDFAPGREFDVAVRHVASLSNQEVPAYTAIDARFGWQLQRNLEFSVTGTNLFGTSHVEFGSPAFRGKLPTEVFAKLVWKL